MRETDGTDHRKLRQGRVTPTKPILRCGAVLVAVAGASAAPLTCGSAASGPPAQVITVEVATSRSESGTVRTWELSAQGQYVEVAGPFHADVGRRGVGRTHEGAERTPAGVFTLTRAFGNQPNNGTRLPYFLAGPDDWWDENPRSAAYNERVISPTSPGGRSENLYYAGPAYAHAVVINYNTDPVVRGAGSGFFLHVGNGEPTAGCVAIPAAALNQVMRWLDPSRHPVISIGVGAAATTTLRASLPTTTSPRTSLPTTAP
jgi:L,D-peptidoglycan transpeptidase YkuD (ErfK/YbiS/YcfS/YnhG family)